MKELTSSSFGIEIIFFVVLYFSIVGSFPLLMIFFLTIRKDPKLFNFNGDLLLKAIENTFNRRQTKFPDTIPFALTEQFYNDSQKQVQWKAFVRKAKPEFEVGNFDSVNSDIKKFLIFIINKINENNDLQMVWELKKGWLKKS